MTKEMIKKMTTQTFKYKGITFDPISPLENLQAMETFPVRDEDIFIVTYPKCGMSDRQRVQIMWDTGPTKRSLSVKNTVLPMQVTL